MIALVDVDPARDRALIARWLARPHVARWWGDPADRLAQFDETPARQHAVILSAGAPIGYLRWEQVDRAALDAVGLDIVPDHSIDVDIFIGEPSELHRGAGPAALELLVRQLVDTTTAPLAGLCTSVDNAAAIRAFEKAGFDPLTSYDDPVFGPCHVMARRLHNAQ